MIKCSNPFFGFLIILYFWLAKTNEFHVEKSGIFPVEDDDIGIRFYLTISSNEPGSIDIVKAYDPECCWQVEPGDVDCDSMKLFGGFPTKIDYKETKNVTFVFSNIYPLDRIGSCKFYLKISGAKTVVHEVFFNTSKQERPGSWFKRLYEGGPEVYVQCRGVDENARNSCQPFDCSKKYNGYRSFYRVERGKCEPVNQCKTGLGSDNLPTSAFDFEYNRCKSLIHGDITKDEKDIADDLLKKSSLAQELNSYEDVNPNDLLLNCKNGVQEGRFCRCKKGWKTVSVTTSGGGVKMDWCSKKVPIKNAKPKTLKIVLLTFVAAFCFGLFLLVFYAWWRLFLSDLLVLKETVDGAKRFPIIPNFPFQLNTKWKLGSKMFDSNTGKEVKRTTGNVEFDALDENMIIDSDEEIFDAADYKQITKLSDRKRSLVTKKINKQKNESIMFEYPGTSRERGESQAQSSSKDSGKSTAKSHSTALKDQTIHVTSSDRFVLVPKKRKKTHKTVHSSNDSRRLHHKSGE